MSKELLTSNPVCAELRAYHKRHLLFSHGLMAVRAADEIDRLTARVAELEGEIRDYEGPKCADLLAENTQFTYQIVALEAERDRLRAALEEVTLSNDIAVARMTAAHALARSC